MVLYYSFSFEIVRTGIKSLVSFIVLTMVLGFDSAIERSD